VDRCIGLLAQNPLKEPAMRKDRKDALKAELAFARAELEKSNRVGAFSHLERAHIIGQLGFLSHFSVHIAMVRFALSARDWREIRGQLLRLAATIPGHLFGWLPIGNTGGANVSALKPMPIPPDLQPYFSGFSLRRQIIRQRVIVVVLLVLGAVVFFGWKVYVHAGENLTVLSQGVENCEKLVGYEGAEDIVIDDQRRLAYAVGGNRRSFRGGGPGRATIVAIPLDQAATRETVDLGPSQPRIFRSFGADLYISADGIRRLFVANRPDGPHTVEVMRLGKDGRFIHERTISSPLLRNPNEVFALAPDRILVTLDKEAAAGTFAEIVEGAIDRPTGRVLYIGPNGARIVASGLHMANGIALSPNGRSAFVSEMVGRRLAVFDRDSASERWTLRSRIPLPAGPDNLTVDRQGRVLIAGHPKLLTLGLGYQHSEERISPTMIMRFNPATRELRTLLSSDGREIAAGSIAAVDERSGTMLIGSAFGPHILRCAAIQ
jgi:arylesterase / paraoxonase